MSISYYHSQHYHHHNQQPFYQQPFVRKKSLQQVGQPIVLHRLLSQCIHQIYFQNKKLSELEIFRFISSALHQRIRPNVSSSVMYQIIMGKVQQVCEKVRQLIKDSYKKLLIKKQYNNDMKHHTDSWNVNFNKFRKANLQLSMNKVYGPIAHIICTYHNSLIDCNKEVYDLWKVLYQYSQIKDLQFKTLQGNLNEIVLEELMREYPKNQFIPLQVMPMISSYEKHQFIFKEIWGFQKRKGVVQFQGKKEEDNKNIEGNVVRLKLENQLVRKSQRNKQKQLNQLSSMYYQQQKQLLPRRLQKPQQKLSPPKPIPSSLQQNKPIPFTHPNTSSTSTHDNTLQLQLNMLQLQQQFANLDTQTRMRIFEQLYQFKQIKYQQFMNTNSDNSQGLRQLAMMSRLFNLNHNSNKDQQQYLQHDQQQQQQQQQQQLDDIIFDKHEYHKRLLQSYTRPIQIDLDDQDGQQQQGIQQQQGQQHNNDQQQQRECSDDNSSQQNGRSCRISKNGYFCQQQSAIHRALANQGNREYSKMLGKQNVVDNDGLCYIGGQYQLQKLTNQINIKNLTNQLNYIDKQTNLFLNNNNTKHINPTTKSNNFNIYSQSIKNDQYMIPEEKQSKYKQVLQQLKLINQTFNGKFQINHNIHHNNTEQQQQLEYINSQRLPQLLHIDKSKRLEQTLIQAKQKLTKMIQKQTQFLQQQKITINQFTNNKQKQSFIKKSHQFINKTDRDLNILNDFQLQQQLDQTQKQPDNFYQTLKKYYQPKQLLNQNTQKSNQKLLSYQKNKNNKKSSQSQIYFAKNVPGSALAEFISDKKSFSQTLQSLTSNNKLSSKLQKISRQQIFDQIYQVAKQKQKRGHNLKMTYKKISYQLRGGQEKNQIKITQGSFTTDDLNWIQDLPQKTKYNLSQSTDFGEKLIDQPNQDICQQQKPQKKKKKKKKKKNKQKKQVSESNQNFDKASISSFNQDQQDLQPLNQFRKKSIYDIFKLRKTLGWSQGQSIQQYLEANQILEREKQQQLLMQKKIEIYEKTGEKNQQRNNDREKALSKQKKSKKENYTEDELKLFQFLQNLQIKDENRQKCVVTQETLQRIISKRKQIISLQIFTKNKEKIQAINQSNQKDNQEPTDYLKTNNSNPKSSKAKNKKKKK